VEKFGRPFRGIHEGGLPRPEGLGYYLLPLRGKTPPFTFHLSPFTFSLSQTVGILNWLVVECSYQRCMTLLYRV
jgi:hypothetical protein